MTTTTKETDWVVWSVDAFGLWFRKGGQFALVGIFFGLLVRMIDSMPRMGSHGLLLIGFALGLMAIVRMLPYIRLGSGGSRADGYVSSTKKQRTVHSSRSSTVKHRIAYRYEVDGVQYKRESDWVRKKAFSKLGRGDRIDVLFDPDNPEMAQPAIVVPSTNPEFFAT